MFCTHCGKQNPEHANFCFSCGTPIVSVSNIASPISGGLSSATNQVTSAVAVAGRDAFHLAFTGQGRDILTWDA